MTFQLIEMGVPDNRGLARAVTEKIAAVTLRAAAVLKGGGEQVPEPLQRCLPRPFQVPCELLELLFDPVVIEGSGFTQQLVANLTAVDRVDLWHLCQPTMEFRHKTWRVGRMSRWWQEVPSWQPQHGTGGGINDMPEYLSQRKLLVTKSLGEMIQFGMTANPKPFVIHIVAQYPAQFGGPEATQDQGCEQATLVQIAAAQSVCRHLDGDRWRGAGIRRPRPHRLDLTPKWVPESTVEQ